MNEVGSPKRVTAPGAGLTIATCGAVAVTNTLIRAVDALPPLSVRARGDLMHAGVSVRLIVGPVPICPSTFDCQTSEAVTSPSCGSVAVAVKVVLVPFGSGAPFAGAVMATVGRPVPVPWRKTTSCGFPAAASRDAYFTTFEFALVRPKL
jgi:hypothetical protein